MLFVDMRGYTSLAESQSPEEVVGLLNRFYAQTLRKLQHTTDAEIATILVGTPTLKNLPSSDPTTL